ncbi:hypothetical protein HY950_03830 [Candidatus Gottesmanbacteria bacterium]|nr:hypothetical protein [Candidatus Gottesmanbacteria bacterium]
MRLQRIGIKLVLFSVIDGTLRVYSEQGNVPSLEWTGEKSLDQTVDELVRRIPGLATDQGYREQLYTFSSTEVSPSAEVPLSGTKVGEYDVAIAYYVLLGEHKIPQSVRSRWIPYNAMTDSPDLVTITYAVQRLRWKIEYTNVVYSLLPAAFTLGQLQRVYEAILGKQVDKRNFRKKILSLGILKDTGKKKRTGRARPAEAYSFKKRTLSYVEVL